jgi:hypothetical protein
MTMGDIAELKRAYQVLGVPLSASALSIKQAYRRIAKRWHPDLYPSGTASHEEATGMMKVINGAYLLVQHAPLRYHVETYPLAAHKKNQAVGYSDREPREADRNRIPVTDRFEFWVRFVCGALLGAVTGLRLFLSFFEHPAILMVVTGSLVLGCGFGAARYGDRFWHSILQRWWLWG